MPDEAPVMNTFLPWSFFTMLRSQTLMPEAGLFIPSTSGIDSQGADFRYFPARRLLLGAVSSTILDMM